MDKFAYVARKLNNVADKCARKLNNVADKWHNLTPGKKALVLGASAAAAAATVAYLSGAFRGEEPRYVAELLSTGTVDGNQAVTLKIGSDVCPQETVLLDTHRGVQLCDGARVTLEATGTVDGKGAATLSIGERLYQLVNGKTYMLR